MSNRIKVFGLVAIATLTAAMVWTALGSPSGLDGRPSPSAAASPVRSPVPELPPEPVAATYLDQILPPDAPPAPTGSRTQSKLWVAAGAWWAVMLEPRSMTFHIYELVDSGKSWRDTGTRVDERPAAQPDTLWDGQHLYIVSAGTSASSSAAARLIRYTFNEKERRFSLDPNFPIRITDAGVDSMVLARDSTGKLWTVYVADDGQVTVNQTLGGDLFWGKPSPLPVPGSLVTTDDVADVIALGGSQVAVLWSSIANGTFYLSTHEDGDPDAAWSAPEVALSGHGMANGELRAVSSADGRLYALVRTALDDDPASSGQSPELVLLQRTAKDTWTSTLFGRIQDQHAAPLVALDAAAGIVYGLGTAPKKGGAIYFKRSREDQPSFPSGVGSPMVSDPAAIEATAGTTTKGLVGPDTGLVVVAYDRASRRYLHGVVDLGGGIAAGPTTPAEDPGPQLVFADDFNPWPVGSRPAIGWEPRAGDPVTSFTIRKPPGNKTNSASLSAPASAGEVRACKDFPAMASGDVTVDVRVRLSRLPPADAVLTEVQGPGIQAASVRFGSNGMFAYISGAIKTRTTVPFRAGAWYRSIVVVHVASQTYDWQLLNAAGRRLIAVNGLSWRTPTRSPVDAVCFRVPGGPRLALNWDDIRVIR
jgi:hypothetical protein